MIVLRSGRSGTPENCVMVRIGYKGPLRLNSEGCYGQTVRNIAISLDSLYRVGPEIMCGDFREIRRKYVGKVAKSVF